MYRLGEGLEGQVTAITIGEQATHLFDVVEAIALTHQHPVAVAHGVEGQRRILDAGQVNQAGARGEQCRFTGPSVVKGVVHQRKARRLRWPQDGDGLVDGGHGASLESQRRVRKAQWLDEPHEPMTTKDCPQLHQRLDHIGGCWCLVGRGDQRTQHQTPGARRRCPFGQVLGLNGTLFVPHIERIQRIDAEYAQTQLPGQFSGGNGLIERRQAVVADVVAQLHRVDVELDGQMHQLLDGVARTGHMVKGKVQ